MLRINDKQLKEATRHETLFGEWNRITFANASLSKSQNTQTMKSQSQEKQSEIGRPYKR